MHMVAGRLAREVRILLDANAGLPETQRRGGLAPCWQKRPGESSPSSNSKKRGAARPDLRSTLAEACGGVGSARPAADRRAPEGIRGSSENWSPLQRARVSCPDKYVPHDSRRSFGARLSMGGTT